MISPTICPYPFAHQHIDPNGDIKYCCNAKPGTHTAGSGEQYNVKTNGMLEAWNSSDIRKLRLDLIAGLEPVSCEGCWKRESPDHTQGSSMRLQAAFGQIPINTILDRIEYARTHNGHVLDNPKDFQIMSGNLCNLACKMCGPRYSNTWSKFFRRQGYTTLQEIKFNRTGGAFANDQDSAIYLEGDQDWPITNPLNTILPEYYSDIRHIFLTGGEPTLIIQNIEFLEELVSTGDSQHIELRFSTNLTNINQRLLNVLNHFGKIGINMSLDGMSDIAYIQRTPSNWNQILKNTDFLMSWLTDYQKRSGKYANITVNTVVSALNIHHVLDLWSFLAERYTYNFHMGFSALIDSYDNFFIGQAPKAVIDQLLIQLPDARDRILKYSPNMQQRLESFEFHLRQDIYSDSYTDIQYMLNGIQSVHPELNIQEIYRIYYPDAV
jgi:pyruvate-formate lyase-activating enzyme